MNIKKEINDIPQEIKDKLFAVLREQKKYKELAELKRQAIRLGRPMQAMELGRRMASLEEALLLEYLKQWEGEVKAMDELQRAMSEEDTDLMNAYGNAIIMLSDVLETLVMESNQLLKKYHPDFRIEMFDKLNDLAKEAKKHVSLLNKYADDKFYTNTYGDMTDKLFDMVVNKAKSFINKLKKREEKINKKAA